MRDDDFPVVRRPRGGGLPDRPVQEIRCGRCGAVEDHTASPSRLPAHTICAHFGRRGWKVGARGKHLCPACRGKTRPAVPRAGSTPVPVAEAVAMPAPNPAANKPSSPSPSSSRPSAAPRPAAANENAPSVSAPASRAIVDLYVLLEDKYDRARKAYVAGYDDARVAKETGLAVAVVSERRERDFGPLVVDTTREDLIRTVAAVSMEIGRVTAEARGAQEALAAALARLADAERKISEVQALAARLGAPAIAKAA